MKKSKENANHQEEDENNLTQHAMRLSASSLKEDWDNEDDAHWDSFLE